ncbi:MAG: hypothetical protein K2K31_03200, partial [Clostridia bacterium]|nr:hypothetical protein [Clostridia bacterium]
MFGKINMNKNKKKKLSQIFFYIGTGLALISLTILILCDIFNHIVLEISLFACAELSLIFFILYNLTSKKKNKDQPKKSDIIKGLLFLLVYLTLILLCGIFYA